MSILKQNDSLLLIIDFQEKLVNAASKKEMIIKNAEIMTKASCILNIPVIITEQYPKGLGYTIQEINNLGKFLYFEKTSFSAIDNFEILNAIKNSSKKQIILFGIETHICVSQTAQALNNLGYEVFLISNASSSRQEFEHNMGLERMKSSGINIITAEICLFEWLKTSKHENFKEIQKLIL